MNTATLGKPTNSYVAAATTIPNAVSKAQLQAAIAANELEQTTKNAVFEAGIIGGNLAGMANPATGALNAAQKQFVQGAIIETAARTGQQIPTKFAEQLIRENSKEAIKAATEAAISESGKKAGQEAVNAAIKASAKELVAETAEAAGKASLRETAKAMTGQAAKIATTKLGMEAANNVATDVASNALAGAGATEAAKAGTKSTLASAVPIIGAVASAGVAVGGAAWEQHKLNKELIHIYAKDLHDVLGVDPTKASIDDLKKLVATDKSKYDALNQELDKEFLISASVGAGGSIGGGAAGTAAGTVAGAGIAAGITAITGGTGIVAAPFIIKACAFTGGIAGSMAGGNSVQTFYKNVTGQDKETCIDAMRKLDAKVQSGEEIGALDVVRVIVGNDKEFDAAVQKLNAQGKKLNELSAEEQVHLVMKQFPNLNHSATIIADGFNKGELKADDVVSLTKIDTAAAITQKDYGWKVVEVEKAAEANNIVPFTKISAPSAEMGKSVEGNREIGVNGGGFQAQIAAQQNASQSTLVNAR